MIINTIESRSYDQSIPPNYQPLSDTRPYPLLDALPIFFDEAHIFGTWDSQHSVAARDLARSIPVGRRLAVTGTPTESHPGEMAKDRKSTRLNSSHVSFSYSVVFL